MSKNALIKISSFEATELIALMALRFPRYVNCFNSELVKTCHIVFRAYSDG